MADKLCFRLVALYCSSPPLSSDTLLLLLSLLTFLLPGCHSRALVYNPISFGRKNPYRDLSLFFMAATMCPCTLSHYLVHYIAGGRSCKGQGVDRGRWIKQGNLNAEEDHGERQALADHVVPRGESRDVHSMSYLSPGVLNI